MTALLRCHACGAALVAGARFCGTCGAASRAHVRGLRDEGRSARRGGQRAAMALGVVMVATLVGLLVSDGEAESSAWQFGMLLAAAAIAALVHGRVSESIPLRTHFRWCIAAIPAAAVTFAIAIGYVALLPSLPGPDDTAPAATPLLALVVFAPIGEELLCRGVAYRAGLSLASPRAAILLAAIVFAFLHGLGGGWVLELPHRFAAGVVFGWLRWRSGSLLPAMLAHALHNGVAWWWDGAGGS